MLDYLLSAIEQCAPDVHPKTMSAVIYHESKGNPFAIGVNTKKIKIKEQPTTKEAAISAAKKLMDAGANIDMGLGQINSANLEWLKLSVEDVFDTCKNLQAASKILTANYKYAKQAFVENDQAALRAALSSYNTGNQQRGLINGYVENIYRSALTLEKRDYVVPILNTTNYQVNPEEHGENEKPFVLRAVGNNKLKNSKREGLGKSEKSTAFDVIKSDAETESALVY